MMDCPLLLNVFRAPNLFAWVNRWAWVGVSFQITGPLPGSFFHGEGWLASQGVWALWQFFRAQVGEGEGKNVCKCARWECGEWGNVSRCWGGGKSGSSKLAFAHYGKSHKTPSQSFQPSHLGCWPDTVFKLAGYEKVALLQLFHCLIPAKLGRGGWGFRSCPVAQKLVPTLWTPRLSQGHAEMPVAASGLY